MTAGGVVPFTVTVPDAALDDLADRLSRVRSPRAGPGSGWSNGTDVGYLDELLSYWRDEYDWRVQEQFLNALPQFTTAIGGMETHFLHVRSSNPDAMPLLLTHGWPGSVYEFHQIIPLLAEPQAHGGDRGDAFHVVAPSLPGFGWSEAPVRPGFGSEAVAMSHAELMARLGYQRYGLQGGDWGARVSAQHARLFPASSAGLHLNMTAFLPLPANPDLAALSLTEQADVRAMNSFRRDGLGYMAIQSTRPLTLGHALSDSPAGLAAWIVDKFRAWSDCSGDVDGYFGKDVLLTDVMIYWVTNSITSSMTFYLDNRDEPWTGRVEAPVAVAVFPAEMSRIPRAWVEPYLNVTRWTRFERGGHFAALEVPELLAADVRQFFRSLR